MSAGPDKSLLYRYALNQCTAEEKIFVEEWVNSDEKVKLQLELVKNIMMTKQEAEPPANSKEEEPISSFKSMKILWYLLIATLIIVFLIIKINN
ncbi:MAG: hypothetical protein IPI50_10305 [Saprospiraceae bacterium]|nr:hypothetical protein [Saprospiraceae bacterium]